jgi:hypothetical protein
MTAVEVAALLAKMATSAGIVVFASLVVERSGPLLGALVATLPISMGPAYAFLALEHGPGFVAAAALASLPSVAGIGALVAVYVVLAQRRGLALSLGAGLLAWLVVAVVGRAYAGDPAASLALNAMVYAAGLAVVRTYRGGAFGAPPARRWWDVPLRATGVMAMVAATVLLGRLAGPEAAGVAALAPVVFGSLALILHPRLGGKASAAVLANRWRRWSASSRRWPSCTSRRCRSACRWRSPARSRSASAGTSVPSPAHGGVPRPGGGALLRRHRQARDRRAGDRAHPLAHVEQADLEFLDVEVGLHPRHDRARDIGFGRGAVGEQVDPARAPLVLPIEPDLPQQSRDREELPRPVIGVACLPFRLRHVGTAVVDLDDDHGACPFRTQTVTGHETPAMNRLVKGKAAAVELSNHRRKTAFRRAARCLKGWCPGAVSRSAARSAS